MSIVKINATDSRLLYCGRVMHDGFSETVGNWAGISVTIKFIGTELKVIMFGSNNYFNVIYKNDIVNVIDCEHDKSEEYTAISGLEFGEHEVTIFKRTEPVSGKVYFKEFIISGVDFLQATKKFDYNIEFLGDSITTGYGILGEGSDEGFKHCQSDNYLTYGAIASRKLKADFRMIAHSGKGVYRNYEMDNYEVIPDVYKHVLMYDSIEIEAESWIPDYIVINLGTNDFAIEPPQEVAFLKSYYTFILQLKERYPQVKIICCVGPLLNDKWPIDISSGEPYKSLSMCRAYIKKVINVATSKNIPDLYFLELENRSSELGYSADFHPSRKQAEFSANELVSFIEHLEGKNS